MAISLDNYGNGAAFVCVVPAHEIGKSAVNALRRYGVDTGLMLRQGPRLGLCFVEKGASQRGSKVICDRAGSSMALSQPADCDWEAILKGAVWFHFTGITPALGGKLPEICLDALRAAKGKHITVSCDLNYRSKFWSKQQAGGDHGQVDALQAASQ